MTTAPDLLSRTADVLVVGGGMAGALGCRVGRWLRDGWANIAGIRAGDEWAGQLPNKQWLMETVFRRVAKPRLAQPMDETRGQHDDHHTSTGSIGRLGRISWTG
ncbi:MULTISPECIES: hypothetical protein [unclassified Bradyrhizobium]|uniref:hypothetical protein n=1 Tax=unclassified Bradyrhizobium TaxID=2631580 RepID=UPI0028EDA5AA|nr:MULTISPECIES: hypothetical protein [unclassified Bradyrhizobium]